MKQKQIVLPDDIGSVYVDRFWETYSSTVDIIYLIKLNPIGNHFSAEELFF